MINLKNLVDENYKQMINMEINKRLSKVPEEDVNTE